MIAVTCRKKPLPLFTKKPVISKPVLQESMDSGHGSHLDSQTSEISQSQMSGPLGNVLFSS